ncbi:MAG: hypothetical protein CMI36_00330 [Owenweeksia sp.]|nr:hypothetical protein [Owenweeksia sp.]MBF97411.1 hypothetical protein [Owenweeksia sp.]HCQ17022.1 hypothetical protein [Cryomorphaceae bacterium]
MSFVSFFLPPKPVTFHLIIKDPLGNRILRDPETQGYVLHILKTNQYFGFKSEREAVLQLMEMVTPTDSSD